MDRPRELDFRVATAQRGAATGPNSPTADTAPEAIVSRDETNNAGDTTSRGPPNPPADSPGPAASPDGDQNISSNQLRARFRAAAAQVEAKMAEDVEAFHRMCPGLTLTFDY